MQFKEIAREVNIESLQYFLTFRYVPGPATMFKNIYKLLPAHIMTCKDCSVKIHKYWNIGSFKESNNTEDYYVKNLLNLLKESIKLRLMSEVPLGAYLSGGLDSSFLVGLMSEMMDEPVKTFSVGFGVEEDELEYAKIVADHFGTEHHELMVEPDASKILPKIIWHFDEPVADAAAIPTYLMSELTKKYATVVLSGEGADELLAGYPKYKILYNGWRYGKLVPKFIRSNLIRIAPKSTKLERALKCFSGIDNKEKSYLELVSVFNDAELNELYMRGNYKKKDLIETKIKPYFKGAINNSINQLIALDVHTWLPDDLLAKNDKMTMAHAIEARVPFLDPKLVEFSTTIPANLKLKGSTEKYVLRKAMKGIIPKSIIDRKKQGFTVPIDQWLKKDLLEIVEQILSESNLHKQGYFKYEFVQKVLNASKKPDVYRRRQFWSLLTFGLWHKIFIENDELFNPLLRLNDFY